MSDFPARKLLNWYDQHQRRLPWRDTENPYKIWVSEIMLQQTRVDTVVPYYHRFLKTFPHILSLAEADRNELLKVWEGLGYYSRARNFQDAARTVVQKHGGEIPKSYRQLLELKGIGPYTAAAISSIAWNHTHAVVDGNVIRVFARYFGLTDDMRSQRSRKRIQEIADQVIDRERPGDFNQAVMELGATVCNTSSPNCISCPLAVGCQAYRTASTDRIPYLAPKKRIPHHTIAVGVIGDDHGRLLIALRPEEKMLGGMWEFPGGKKRKDESIRQAVKRELKEELHISVQVNSRITLIKHTYSHFRITMHAYHCRLDPPDQKPTPNSSQQLRWVYPNELGNYPFPKANKQLTKTLVKEGG